MLEEGQRGLVFWGRGCTKIASFRRGWQ